MTDDEIRARLAVAQREGHETTAASCRRALGLDSAAPEWMTPELARELLESGVRHSARTDAEILAELTPDEHAAMDADLAAIADEE